MANINLLVRRLERDLKLARELQRRGRTRDDAPRERERPDREVDRPRFEHAAPPPPRVDTQHKLVVLPGEGVTYALRYYYKTNRVGAEEWVDVEIRGGGHGPVDIGLKDAAHNDGLPLNVRLWTQDPGAAEIDGLCWGNYGGTFVASLVVENLDVRKAPGQRAAVSDISFNGESCAGNVWLRSLRPLQNVAEALAGENYEGLKWGYKPSDGSDLLVISGSRHGVDSMLGEPTRIWEHPIYETGSKRIFIEDNDLRGGNRTPAQCNTPRAAVSPAPWPQVSPDTVVIRGNRCSTGLLWGHSDGGAMIVWESSGLVLIEENDVVSEYGGIAIGHQPTSAAQYHSKGYPYPHNFQVSPEGHTHKEVIVRNNKVHILPGSSRAGISVSSALKATIEGNEILHEGSGPDYVIDGGFAAKSGAPRCTDVLIDAPADQVETYDPISGKYVPWSPQADRA